MDCQNEWIDLTKDKNAKILKKIIRPGEIYYDRDLMRKCDEDLYPRRGDRVKVKLIGKTSNGKTFLNCYDEPIEYNLFTGENIKGLDLAINSMMKNELCEASISREYATGDVFNENEVPKDENLIYKIELLDWENEFLTRKNDGGVIRKILKKGFGYEVPMYNSMVAINLVAYYQVSPESEISMFSNETNIKFNLGEGSQSSIPCGLEYALYKMKVNEKNRVYILQKYQDFKSFLLPVNFYRTIYEVELISFQIKEQIYEMSVNERFKLAEQEKNRGSTFFKSDKYHLSLKCYSDVLKAIGPPNTNLTQSDLNDQQESLRDELIITAYNNIALCYLRLKMPKESLKYSNWCLELDATNIKATYRAGLAHYDRNDFKQSIELFNRCLELNPTNKAALNMIKQAQEEIKKYENKEKKIFSNLFQALANDEEIQSKGF